MENQILKAITHIKTVSKKRPDPAKVLHYCEKNSASNYDYQAIVEKIQEMITDDVIDENYRIINPITDSENFSQEDDDVVTVAVNDSDSDVDTDTESAYLLESTRRISQVPPQNLNTPGENEDHIDNEDDSDINDTPGTNIEASPSAIGSHKYTSTDSYKYVELTTFDTFYDDYIEFKYYVDDIIKNLHKELGIIKTFNKELDIQTTSQKNTTNDKKEDFDEKIQQLQETNKELQNENKTLYKIIDLLQNTKNNVGNTTITSNENNWEDVRSNRKQKATARGDEQLKLNNRFQVFSVQETENNNEEVEHIEINIENNTDINKESVRRKHSTFRNNNRPNICTTEKYLENEKLILRKKVVPGNRLYAETTAYGKKILFTGDSHLKRIQRNRLSKSFQRAKCILKPFGGAKIEDMEHYIIPNLEQNKPDVVVIHVGSNNISYNKLNVDPSVLAEKIINIGNNCIKYGVEDVVISSIFVKESVELSAYIRKVNDELRDLCYKHKLHFVSNDNITRKHLCGDGVHLVNEGTSILGGNIVSFINRNILNTHFHDLD